MKVALLSLSLLAACTTPGFAQATSEVGQPVDGSRIERSQAKQRALFGDVPSTTQPELMQVLRNLTYGDVYAIGNLDDKTRGLVTLVVLTTNQNLPQIKAHTDAALNVGVSQIQIREALYQAAAFVGFPKVINALQLVDEVLASRGIVLPLEPKATVADHERFEKGRAIQQLIYGGRMRENLKDLPGSLPDDVSRLVTNLSARNSNTLESEMRKRKLGKSRASARRTSRLTRHWLMCSRASPNESAQRRLRSRLPGCWRKGRGSSPFQVRRNCIASKRTSQRRRRWSLHRTIFGPSMSPLQRSKLGSAISGTSRAVDRPMIVACPKPMKTVGDDQVGARSQASLCGDQRTSE